MTPEIAQIVKQSSPAAARRLLGCYLTRATSAGLLRLKIVETEAYHQSDPASHSCRGLTPRTAPMFEAGGRLYIYFSYGMHFAINIVVGRQGVGEAVLIRAAEPLEGLPIMQANRRLSDVRNLANGPGKLAQAMGITDTRLSGAALGEHGIILEPGERLRGSEIVAAPRIGISRAVDLSWRFYIRNNPFVSKL